MQNDKVLELWNDMWRDGNWVPSIADSLNGLTAEEAEWAPASTSHCIWQEVAHIIFWRQVTLNNLAGIPGPSEAEVNANEFAIPDERTAVNWTAEVAKLLDTQEKLARAIEFGAGDLSRVTYHLIHDAYHLGRITHLRQMMGVQPKF